MRINGIESSKTGIPAGCFTLPSMPSMESATFSSTTSSWSKFVTESTNSSDFSLNSLEEQLINDLFDALIEDNLDKALSLAAQILDHAKGMEEGEARNELEGNAYAIRLFVRVYKNDISGAIDDYFHLRTMTEGDFDNWDFNIPSLLGVAYLAKGDETRGIDALISSAQQGDMLSRVVLREKQVPWTPIAVELSEFDDLDSPIWYAEIREAADHYLQGEYEEALQICNEVIDKYTESEENDSAVIAHFNFKTDPAFMLRADIYMAMGRYEEAKQAYEKILIGMPFSTDITFMSTVASKFLRESTPCDFPLGFGKRFYLKVLDLI